MIGNIYIQQMGCLTAYSKLSLDDRLIFCEEFLFQARNTLKRIDVPCRGQAENLTFIIFDEICARTLALRKHSSNA